MAGHKKNKQGSSTTPAATLSSPASVVAQTIAHTLPADGSAVSAAPALRLPTRAMFPGLGGPRMAKAMPRVTAFDPPPVVAVPAAPAEPPPPPSRPFEHEPPTAPDRPPLVSPPPPPAEPSARPTTRPPSRREPEPSGAMPFPVASAPPFAAAHANVYTEDFQARERERWGKNRHVPQPDTKLVHCWALALSHFPAGALTLWLTRTAPAKDSYELWIAGDALFDPMFPERKLYEVVRRERRQPSIAESFVGRIQGKAENGTTYDCGYGEIHLPPEPVSGASPTTWGANAGAPPWGNPPPPPGYGPPPWGPPPGYGSPWGPPPGYAPPWGGPPPPWAQAYGQPPPPPPANVQSDPLLLEVWRQSAEATANAQRLTAESASKASDGQAALMRLLLDRVLAPPAAAAPASGGIKETIGMLKDFSSFVETVRGPREESASNSRGLTIHNLGNGERLVETKDGEIDVGATVGLGLKSGITELVGAIGKMRGRGPSMAQTPPPVAAASAGAAALSGARMQKGPPPAAPASTNGAAAPS